MAMNMIQLLFRRLMYEFYKRKNWEAAKTKSWSINSFSTFCLVQLMVKWT